MIAEIEVKVRELLGDRIFGADDDTLEGVIKQTLDDHQLSLVTVESGLGNQLAARLQTVGVPQENTQTATSEEIHDTLKKLRTERSAQYGIGAVVQPLESGTQLTITLLTPDQELNKTRKFLGSSSLAAKWAVNTALDLLRRQLLRLN